MNNTTHTTAVLELRGVTQAFPDGDTQRVVLDSVNFSLRTGELVAVMGRSGSGKSTLLNVIAGLLTPTAGETYIKGTALRHATTQSLAALRRSEFGIVFQRNNLIEALTLVENLALPLEFNGVKPRIAQAQASLILDDHGLSAIAKKLPHQVSGGQRQFVAVLAALSSRRNILLADEPTGALDSVSGDEVMRLIRTHIDAGASGLFVTHDARDAGWADRIIHIEDGVITTDTGRDELFASTVQEASDHE